MKKKLTIIFILLMTLVLSAFPVQSIQAASGSITVSASSRTVTIGKSVTVTVRVSSASDIGSWKFTLNYDSSRLRLNSGTPNVAGFFTYDGQKSASYNYSFTTIATGTAGISLSGGAIVGMDETYMSVSSGSTSINITTASSPSTSTPSTTTKTPANLSTNNLLSGLKVDGVELTPAFDKSVLEYSVELEAGIEKITIAATAEDAKATITGAGEVPVTEGENRLEVKVRAENGDEKIYVIKALVKEFDPIEVFIGNDRYTVIRKKGVFEAPKNYVETTVLINDVEVPAFKNEITKLTLVGLKSETGETGLFVYNETKDSYAPYKELSLNGISIYPFKPGKSIKIPDGYEEFILKIGEEEFTAYRINKSTKFSLLYGMNLENGKEGFYLYDSVDGTLQRYYDDESLYLKDVIWKHLVAIIVLGTGVVALGATSGIMIYKYIKLKKSVVN